MQSGDLLQGKRSQFLVLVAYSHVGLITQDLQRVGDDEDMDAVDEVDPIVQRPADCDRQVQFLVDLADETILERFPQFELAARKLPLVALVLQKDETSVALDDAFYRTGKRAAR